MKYHVQFLELTPNKKKIVEACGSDAVLILDGRNSLQTMTIDAIKQFHKMTKYLHNYCGWRIKKGDRFSNSVKIKQWILSGEHTQHAIIED